MTDALCPCSDPAFDAVEDPGPHVAACVYTDPDHLPEGFLPERTPEQWASYEREMRAAEREVWSQFLNDGDAP